MGRVSGYSTDGSILGTDYVYGVQASGPNSKRFLMSDIATYMFANIPANSLGFGAIDWSTTGGIWWEEMARQQLTVGGDVMSVSFTARQYLMIIIQLFGTGGTISVPLICNADAGNNYAYRISANGGADATTTSTSSMLLTGAATYANFGFFGLMINKQTFEAGLDGFRFDTGTAGAANAPNKAEYTGKWANTVAQVDQLGFTNTGSGNYDVGSTLIVLGHD